MPEGSKFNPEIEALSQETRAVFEEADLAKRQDIEKQILSQDALVKAWREGRDAGGQPMDTETAMRNLSGLAADTKQEPMTRLGAFEHMVQLTEREEPQNREVIEKMIEQVLTEPNPRLQEAMLGILGSRFDTRVATEPDKYFGDRPKEERDRVSKQFSNSLDALINEIRVDERLPDEYRQFAEMVAFRNKHRENELRQRMEYMADLYRADANRLWPVFKEAELPPSEPKVQEREPVRLEVWVPVQKNRRLLPEGHIPSPEKQLQADNEPRTGGDTDEVGQKIPLRVFGAFERPDGKYDLANLPEEMGREFIAEMRRIKMARGMSLEERNEARRKAIDAWKGRLRASLTERDRGDLADRQDIVLRVETLVDENKVNTLLKREFGKNDLNEIDPSGGLSAAIDAILESESSTEEQMSRLAEVIKEFKGKTGK